MYNILALRKFFDLTNVSFLLCKYYHFFILQKVNNIADIRPHLKELCEAIATQDPTRAYLWRDTNPSWRTVEEIVRLSVGTPSPGFMGSHKRPDFTIPGQLLEWQCNQCTLINKEGTKCIACGAQKPN